MNRQHLSAAQRNRLRLKMINRRQTVQSVVNLARDTEKIVYLFVVNASLILWSHKEIVRYEHKDIDIGLHFGCCWTCEIGSTRSKKPNSPSH